MIIYKTLSNIDLTKKNSTIFLGIVLLAVGMIAFSSNSFLTVIAQPESEYYYEDAYKSDYDSYEKDNNLEVPSEAPTPEACEVCFETFLNQEQMDIFISLIPIASAIEDVCNFYMDSGVLDQEDFEELLDAVIGIQDPNIQRAFIECLKNAGIVFE